MNAASGAVLLHAYPRRWRREHGTEFSTLLQDYPLTAATVLNTIRSGVGERVTAAPGRYRTGAAVAGFAVVDAAAVHAGITDNVLWAPSTPARAVVLAAALLPLTARAVDIGRRRHRAHR